MTNPKTKAILEQVEILAQTYPDFVYPHDPDNNFPYQYNTGGDPKYPELRGCIIGQAAKEAGIDTSDWDVVLNENNYCSAGIRAQIKDKLREDPYSPEAEILSCIQNLQDIGTPWGKAYAKATTQTE